MPPRPGPLTEFPAYARGACAASRLATVVVAAAVVAIVIVARVAAARHCLSAISRLAARRLYTPGCSSCMHVCAIGRSATAAAAARGL
jgi:hypothetical protein